MARHNSNLPDSLELLLDTMCNTFGGIVFIAISLIIISQLVSDNINTATPEDIDQQRIEQIKKRVELLEAKIAAKKKELNSRHFKAMPSDPQRRKEVETLQSNTESFMEQEQTCQSMLLQFQAALQLVKRLKQEYEQCQAQATQEQSMARIKLRDLKESIRKTKEDILNLRIRLMQIPQKELSFSVEQTTNKSPYWIFMKQGLLYRYDDEDPDYSDVTAHRVGDQLHFSFIRGHAIVQNQEEELEQLFKHVDRQKYFIAITADRYSFDTLLKTRRFLRQKNYMVQWNFRDEFIIILVDDVTYRAAN